MTIDNLLKKSKVDLTETEILMSHVIKKDRSFLQAFPEHKLTAHQLYQFINKLKRRKNNEPLAYILGYKEFFGLNFLVNKNVLIPRDETEKLVEEILDYSKNSKEKKLTMVDVGTGSGAIAVAAAVNNPNLNILATDVSKEALKVAKKNSRLHKVSTIIKFLETNLLEDLKQKVDIIAANLPYIPTKVYTKLPEEIRLFEPKLALDSGKNSRTFYRKLFDQAREKLNPDGIIFYEIDGQIFKLSAADLAETLPE